MIKKSINALSYLESNQYGVEVVVRIGQSFNIGNYLSDTGRAMKLANVLACDGTVTLSNGKSVVTVKSYDEDAKEHFQLEQACYLLMGRRLSIKGIDIYEYPKGKATPIEGYFARVLKSNFKNRAEAVAYFNSPQWAQEVKSHFKFNLLDCLVDPLCQFQEEYLISNRNSRIEDAQKRALLRTEYYQLGLDNKLFKGELPNQEVTPLELPSIAVQRRYIEGEAPYVSYTGDYKTTSNSELEAKIINQWFYEHEEFRVPSYDEQLQELYELELWFDIFKEMSKELKAIGLSTEWAGDEATAMFDRLEELRFILPPVAQYNELLGEDESEEM